VRQSSATETPQPIQSNELCRELRRIGFDETSTLIDARKLYYSKPLSQMLIKMACHQLMKQHFTKSGLFLTHNIYL